MDFMLVENRPGRKIKPFNTTEDILQAILHGDVSLVRQLLDSNQDFIYKTESTKALFLACELGKVEIVDLLLLRYLESGCSRQKKDELSLKNLTVKSVTDVYTENGDTPLSCAARYGHVDICKLLIASGADINQATQYVHQTPLLISIEYGWNDLAVELIDLGADVNITDNVGISPLYAAVKLGHVMVVENLVKAGCDVNIGSQDHAPLFLAARLGLLPIVQVLCKSGCKKDISNKYGVTPLYEATLKGHVDVLQYLIDEGCNVNKTDMYDVSPLHIAAMTGNVQALTILMEGGADPKLKTQSGQTALLLAIERDKYSVVEYLLQIGADILHKPHGCNSLKSIAVVFDRGFENTVEVLLRGCAKMPLPHYPGVTEMFSNNGKLLQMLFLSGIQTIPGVLTVPRLHPHYVEDEDISTWLKEFHKNPLSLKALSRVRIRRSLGNRCLYSVNFLPVPNILKRYICLQDL